MTCNSGELKLLDWMLKETSVSTNLLLKLYKNDVTPSASSVAGDFTEADFTGYAVKTLGRAGWSAASTVSGKAETSRSAESYTAGSSQTIYGYYVVSGADGSLLWAEKFNSARQLSSSDVLSVTPRFTLNSES